MTDEQIIVRDFLFSTKEKFITTIEKLVNGSFNETIDTYKGHIAQTIYPLYHFTVSQKIVVFDGKIGTMVDVQSGTRYTWLATILKDNMFIELLNKTAQEIATSMGFTRSLIIAFTGKQTMHDNKVVGGTYSINMAWDESVRGRKFVHITNNNGYQLKHHDHHERSKRQDNSTKQVVKNIDEIVKLKLKIAQLESRTKSV